MLGVSGESVEMQPYMLDFTPDWASALKEYMGSMHVACLRETGLADGWTACVTTWATGVSHGVVIDHGDGWVVIRMNRHSIVLVDGTHLHVRSPESKQRHGNRVTISHDAFNFELFGTDAKVKAAVETLFSTAGSAVEAPELCDVLGVPWWPDLPPLVDLRFEATDATVDALWKTEELIARSMTTFEFNPRILAALER